MATVHNSDYSVRSGKLNKKDNVIHRVRNGKEHTYSILAPNTNPPSPAQKKHRALFGKINKQVNRIMADPDMTADYTRRMEEYNRSLVPYLPPFPKRFKTLRAFVFADVREQLLSLPHTRRRTKTPVEKTLPRGVRLHILSFADLSATELYEILKARFSVFVMEQKCLYLDLDDIDYRATHFSLRRKGGVIAYARLFEDEISTPDELVLHLGRMLTTERGKGFGRYLMLRVIDEARRRHAHAVCLDAQTHAAAFYAQFGFRTYGNIFEIDHIPHVRMKLLLPDEDL